MIDDPQKTELLMSMLTEPLPIEANITPHLADELMRKTPDIAIPRKCNVVTLLTFDRRVSLSREIESYQRHRIKKLKRQQGRGY